MNSQLQKKNTRFASLGLAVHGRTGKSNGHEEMKCLPSIVSQPLDKNSTHYQIKNSNYFYQIVGTDICEDVSSLKSIHHVLSQILCLYISLRFCITYRNRDAPQVAGWPNQFKFSGKVRLNKQKASKLMT